MMLLAAAAFLLQSLAISASQAAAITGFMPDPAVTLSGSMHFHSHLAGHVHHHDDGEEGHVHDTAPTDPDERPDVDLSTWSMFAPSMTLPAAIGSALPDALAIRIAPPRPETASGIAPPGLIEPPSTPSIA